MTEKDPRGTVTRTREIGVTQVVGVRGDSTHTLMVLYLPEPIRRELGHGHQAYLVVWTLVQGRVTGGVGASTRPSITFAQGSEVKPEWFAPRLPAEVSRNDLRLMAQALTDIFSDG